ncbi:unnamed protein product [Tenebrio molitor]|nr:unnamed protein product [Tenebrio molitor]
MCAKNVRVTIIITVLLILSCGIVGIFIFSSMNDPRKNITPYESLKDSFFHLKSKTLANWLVLLVGILVCIILLYIVYKSIDNERKYHTTDKNAEQERHLQKA